MIVANFFHLFRSSITRLSYDDKLLRSKEATVKETIAEEKVGTVKETIAEENIGTVEETVAEETVGKVKETKLYLRKIRNSQGNGS